MKNDMPNLLALWAAVSNDNENAVAHQISQPHGLQSTTMPMAIAMATQTMQSNTPASWAAVDKGND
eukprot:scaffold122192_cov18-Tisochrysis_lutea.AAC.2